MDREKKERKLLALMLRDLGTDAGKSETGEMLEEVRGLSGEELDRLLTERLDLPPGESLDEALLLIEEPERLPPGGSSNLGSTPDLSHEPRPEERP